MTDEEWEPDPDCACGHSTEWHRRAEISHDREIDGNRLYAALALFDRRDGSPLASIVQAAREGWERSHPDMAEARPWDEFDARIASYGRE